MNLLTIIVLAVLAGFAFLGMKRGLVRKIGGVVSILAASVLVSALLPLVTDLIRTRTPVYETVRSQCRYIAEKKMADLVGGTETPSIDRELVRSLMNQYGLDGSAVDWMSEEELRENAQMYFPDIFGTSSAVSLESLDGLTRIQQTELIRNLPVPDFVQKMMLNYNNSSGYRKLDASGFGEYIAGFIADLVIHIAAFLVTLLVTHLIIWGVLTALDVFAKMPFLYTINRTGGLLVGLVQGILVVWVFFLVLSALSGTEAGMRLMEMVDESVLLRPLYEHNLFLKEITGVIRGML